MLPLLEQVLEKYPNEVKLVHKDFPLRNHKTINKFLRENLTKNDIKNTYGTKEAAAIVWKSDLVTSIEIAG